MYRFCYCMKGGVSTLCGTNSFTRFWSVPLLLEISLYWRSWWLSLYLIWTGERTSLWRSLRVANRIKYSWRIIKIRFQLFFSALTDANIAMSAHIIYSCLDKDDPATLSSKVVNFIREELGFKNLHFFFSFILVNFLVGLPVSYSLHQGSFARRLGGVVI